MIQQIAWQQQYVMHTQQNLHSNYKGEKVTVEELEKNLKTGTLNSLYLLYGEEEYLLETCVKRIKKNNAVGKFIHYGPDGVLHGFNIDITFRNA